MKWEFTCSEVVSLIAKSTSMDPKKMRVGHIVDIGAPLSNPKASADPINFETKHPNIRVESSDVGSKVAHDDLNPGWSDDEDGDAKTSIVVAVDEAKVEIENGEEPATIVTLKSSHPLRLGRIVDVSPSFPKKDAFKNADRFLPDFKPQVNAVQQPAYGMNQSFSSHAQQVIISGLRLVRTAMIVQNSNDRTDAGVKLYNAVASLKRSHDVVNPVNTCGDVSCAPLLEKSFIDEKVKDAAIYGSTTFTNDEMRRLAVFAKKALKLYAGISDLFIGKAWS
uniref:Uncharacterized protein n=1 Tax=Ditylenchus dipsaci TaxID=166011 RepID=A0A915D795_9BILA